MGLLHEKLEIVLKDTMQERWKKKFRTYRWKTVAFDNYTDSEEIAKTVILEAIERVAKGYQSRQGGRLPSHGEVLRRNQARPSNRLKGLS
jgi:transketolase